MEKFNNSADTYRQEGNEWYKKRDFFKALVKYNQSICFAEINSENLGMGYANRSAVYFEMKLYNNCVKNIKLAKDNYYPQKNMEILTSRHEKCVELMKNEQKNKNENIFKLSLPVNKNLPFLANCLKLKEDEKFGRYIITSKDLAIGDVIAKDSAFCSVPISESHFVTVPENNIYQRCNNCLKTNYLHLIPCKFCCYSK